MPPSKSILRRIDETGIALLVFRLVLGVLFVWMGWNKVADPVGFLKQIHLYDLLPESPGIFLNATAIVLPWIEIVCGVALLVGVLLRGAALALAAMLLVFTPAIFLRAVAMMAETGTPFFELSFDCGCGAGEVVTWTKLLENTLLFLTTILILLSRSRRFCLASWLDRRPPAPRTESVAAHRSVPRP